MCRLAWIVQIEKQIEVKKTTFVRGRVNRGARRIRASFFTIK